MQLRSGRIIDTPIKTTQEEVANEPTPTPIHTPQPVNSPNRDVIKMSASCEVPVVVILIMLIAFMMIRFSSWQQPVLEMSCHAFERVADVVSNVATVMHNHACRLF